MPEDDVSIRIRIRGALQAKHDTDKVARGIDNIGDKAGRATRKLAMMNAAQSKSRVSLGPFSTSMRGGALAVGALVLATGKAVPVLLGVAEATATVVGGAGAAGGVGLLALAQATGVVKLGISDLTAALGGNATALKRLDPQLRGFYDTLHAKQQRLKRTAGGSMLPGLVSGAQSASANFGVLNQLVGSTGRTIGGLGADTGRLLGSAGFGADLKTVGGANVQIIDNLGHSAINLASGFRHVAVEAAPLAVWLSEEAKQGSQLVDVWLQNARATGKLSKFFRTARTDLTLLASSTGHLGHGIINLFGAQDVNGTRTLQSLDRLTARFERWTRLSKTQRNVGDAVVAEIPNAVGALMTAIANNLPGAGAVAAKTFFHGFMEADIWGQLLAGGFLAKKLGLFKLGKKLLSGRGDKGVVDGLLGKGNTPANPLFVAVVNGGAPGGGPWSREKRNPYTRMPEPVPTGAPGRAGLFRRALRFAPVAARAAGPEALAAAALVELALNAGHHNYPTRGGAPLRREAAGRPAFVQDPFHRVPDVQVTVQPQAINIDGREYARLHARAVATLGARRK